MTAIRRLVPIMLCVLLSACAGGEGDGTSLLDPCGLGERVDLPLTMIGAVPMLRVRIAGVATLFELDTGAAYSTIERRTALALGLMHVVSHGRVTDITGSHETDIIAVDRLDIGGFTATGRQLQTSDGLPFEGVIGLDLLKPDQMEIDERGGKVFLQQGSFCKGQTPFAEHGAIEMPAIEVAPDGKPDGPNLMPRLLVPIRLDGTLALAMFDTGALAGSLVHPDFAAKLGLTQEAMATDRQVVSRGFYGTAQFRLHRFRQLDLNGEIYREPTLLVGGSAMVGNQMVLGAEYFRSHRVWFDFVGKRVFSLPLPPRNASGS
jgi:hypothetical protein